MGPTLVGMLQESVVSHASLAALRVRGKDGSLQTVTYAELYGAVKEIGTGLIAAKVAAGTHAAILVERDPRGLVADLAVMGGGCVSVPLSPRMSDREIEQVLAHAECSLAIVEDATVLLRLLSLRARLPRLRKVLALDFSGGKPQAGTGDERVLVYTWEEMLKKGRTRIARGDRQFDLRAAGVTPADTATLQYTSGTTGPPKGVMLSHGSIVHNVQSVHASLAGGAGATWLSGLPAWHSFARAMAWCALSLGSTIAASPPADWRVFEDVHELAPDYIVLDPPLLETLEKGIGRRLGFHETVLVRFEKFYQVFSGFIMGRYPRFRREERLLEIFAALPPLLILSPVKVISRFILRGRVRRLLGGRLKAVICGGGPLPAWLDRFFAALGVRVLEAYGLTEASPVVSMRAESAPVLGTVGRPLPSTEVRIAGENGQSQPAGRKGSLLVRGPQVMLGYSRDPEATRRVLSPDGWLTTGDTGLLTVDGNLVITGRARDVISMKSGERVEPGPIELVIQESPYVQQAVIVGDGRDSLGLLVVPQAEALRQWALARKIPPADTRSLVGNPVVYRFYQEEVQARLVNGGVTLPGGRAPRIALLPAPFEVGRELTRTLSKRREAIAELYGPVIDRLYLP